MHFYIQCFFSGTMHFTITKLKGLWYWQKNTKKTSWTFKTYIYKSILHSQTRIFLFMQNVPSDVCTHFFKVWFQSPTSKINQIPPEVFDLEVQTWIGDTPIILWYYDWIESCVISTCNLSLRVLFSWNMPALQGVNWHSHIQNVFLEFLAITCNNQHEPSP